MIETLKQVVEVGSRPFLQTCFGLWVVTMVVLLVTQIRWEFEKRRGGHNG